MYKGQETENLSTADRTEQDIGERCLRCGACAAHCRFLSRRGTPGALAAAHDADPAATRPLAFECSLCSLCKAVCPQKLDPPAMFLEWRQAAVRSGSADLSPYSGILAYERKGCSTRFSFYSLPRECDTVFFPGCTFAGTRPGITLKSLAYLRTRVPSAGIVLDCCTRPSHDLGRKDFFEAVFGEMADYLLSQGVTTIVTVCPSCHGMFAAHGRVRAVSLYEIMAEDPQMPHREDVPPVPPAARVVVQDPCRARHDTGVQAAVRSMAGTMGLPLEKGNGRLALCCGEGAAAGCVRPDHAVAWTRKRKDSAGGRNALTYCAGCVNRLSGSGGHFHILDLVFDRERTLKGKAKVSTAPFTYLNRLRLKRKLTVLPAAVTRERPRLQALEGARPGSSFRNSVRLPVIGTLLGVAAACLAALV